MKVKSGTYSATKSQLVNVPVPQETRTYKPVSYQQVIDLSLEGIHKAGFQVEREIYSWAKEGGVGTGRYLIKNVEDNEMQLQVYWQNSYNKSLPLSFSLQANVLVCTNGMVAPRSVNYFKKKHQGKIQTFTPNAIPEYIKRGGEMFTALQGEREAMKQIQVNRRLVAELLGRLYIEEGILESTQLNIVKRELENPTHNYGSPDSLWALYQHVTFAIGGIHPSHWLQDHLDTHRFFMSVLEDDYYQDVEDIPELVIEDKRQLKLFDV